MSRNVSLIISLRSFERETVKIAKRNIELGVYAIYVNVYRPLEIRY